MCQEKKEEEDPPELNIVSMHRPEDNIKKNKERLITATRNNTRMNRTTITRKQNGWIFQAANN